jgi:hypothetical protein
MEKRMALTGQIKRAFVKSGETIKLIFVKKVKKNKRKVTSKHYFPLDLSFLQEKHAST